MITVIALTLSLLAGGSQLAPPRPDTPMEALRRIIPEPTGQNGYEEFILAAHMFTESFGRSKRIAEAYVNDAMTLGDKRSMVSMNKKALDILRAGLRKPVVEPRQEITTASLFPEFAAFRELAKLLAWEQEVYLADGRVSQAIGSWRDAMQFSHDMQVSTLIAGLVGQACISICSEPLAHHIDQLSYEDCKLLQRTVSALMALPDPLSTVMNGEFRFEENALQALNQPGGKLEDLAELADGGNDENGKPNPFEVYKQSPELFPDDLAKAIEVLHARNAGLSIELRKRPWERKFSPTESVSERVDALVSLVSFSMDKVVGRFSTTDARLRLFGTHAAILAHRWWHGSPPASLDELKLGDLCFDPFTGQQFRYVPSGYTYKLYSVGPGGTDHGGQAASSSKPEEGDVLLTRDGSR
jgi:hypothetical protein